MGVYRETGRLPTEMQLAKMYSVSRQTVRRALGILAEEGLIERRQGSGSRLLDAPAVWAGNNVAVIATFMDDYIFPTLLHHIQSVMEKHSFSTLVYATQNKLNREREILQILIDNPVRGVLVEGVKSALPNPNLDLYRQLERMVSEGTVSKYIIDESAGACFAYIGSESHLADSCYHCKCERCGKLIHMECEELNHIAAHLKADHGFRLNPMRTVFYGVCADCAGKEDAEDGTAEV
jgi:Fe2+ or Zn2+ uptake regulation protein